MQRSAIAFAILVYMMTATGCVQSPSDPQKETSRSTIGEGLGPELERIAVCLSKAVGMLNREPNPDETLGAFVRLVPDDQRNLLAVGLRFDRDGEIVLSDGSPVLWKREFESCFLFVGGSISSMEYTLYSEGHSESAKVSIQATFGDPFGGGSLKEEEPNQALQTTSGTTSES